MPNNNPANVPTVGFTPPGFPVPGPTKGPPLRVTNSFDDTGKMTSVLPREGVDIGPAPDFWADFDQALKRFPPKEAQQHQQQARPGAARQASALRSTPAPSERQPSYAEQLRAGGPTRIPMYTKMVGGPQIVPGRIAAAPWDPSANFSGFAPEGYNPYPAAASFAGPQGAMLTGPGISGGGGQGQGQGQGQARPLDPYPHGTGEAFSQAQMEAARQRSDAEYYGRNKR